MHLPICRYHMAQDRKGRGLNMYPPGKVIFMRPLKVLKRGREGGDSYRKKWDAVWVSPREVIGEGILVSKRVNGGRGLLGKGEGFSTTLVAAGERCGSAPARLPFRLSGAQQPWWRPESMRLPSEPAPVTLAPSRVSWLAHGAAMHL